jgi:hypothetical protein
VQSSQLAFCTERVERWGSCFCAPVQMFNCALVPRFRLTQLETSSPSQSCASTNPHYDRHQVSDMHSTSS